MYQVSSRTAPRITRRSQRRASLSTHDEILKAARNVMAERGPETLTVSEVAHRAGVNRGTAYRYFRTREHLQETVKEWFAGELNRMLGEGDSIGSRMDSLMEFLSQHREVARLWLFALLGDDSDPEYEGCSAIWASSRNSPRAISPRMASTQKCSPEFSLLPRWSGLPGRPSWRDPVAIPRPRYSASVANSSACFYMESCAQSTGQTS